MTTLINRSWDIAEHKPAISSAAEEFDSEHLTVMQDNLFRAEYEVRISELKLAFVKYQYQACEPQGATLLVQYQRGVTRLRQWLSTRWKLFDAAACSSLFCVPTHTLTGQEKRLHRIWLGGSIPADAREVISQWGNAQLEVKNHSTEPWGDILWVWDALQLSQDDNFIPTIGAQELCIGEYYVGNHRMEIYSLAALMTKRVSVNLGFLHQLHDNKYYATLSDYFRFLILIEMGGVYMDIDTLPHRSATLFLIKPEMPNYLLYNAGNEFSHISFLNLFLDETGMIISRKGDMSLCHILAGLDQVYAEETGVMLENDALYERALFNSFYQLWCQHIDRTFLSHQLFCSEYAVHLISPQTVTCGIRGMRLLEDIITEEVLPLSEKEDQSYQQCISRLKQVDWQLDRPLDLAKHVEIFSVEEVPRMAYPAQLRSDIDHYHYYSVLSNDSTLDRVNQLFGEYLIANKRRQIDAGDYWRPTVGRGPVTSEVHEGKLCFLSGLQASETEKNSMAKLIFSTSYLEYCSVGNRAGLDMVSLQRVQNIDPYLSLISVAYDLYGRFIGFFNAGKIQELYGIQADYLYRDEMKPIDEGYDEFVQEQCQIGDYFISSLAIDSEFRGQGYFNLMLEHIKELAMKRGAKKLVLCVWERSDAYPIYLKKGFSIRGHFDQTWPLFFDRLVFLEYPL